MSKPSPPSSSLPGEKKQPEPGKTDYDTLAEDLPRDKKSLPSKLVKFMADKSTTTFQDVEDEVFGGPRFEATIRGLVNRTNTLLLTMK
jgi:hypothetical protein